MNLEDWELEQLIDQRIERFFLIRELKELLRAPEPAQVLPDAQSPR